MKKTNENLSFLEGAAFWGIADLIFEEFPFINNAFSSNSSSDLKQY